MLNIKKESLVKKNHLSKKQVASSDNTSQLTPENKKVNEFSKSTIVCLKYPDKVSIEFVQANELRHYELFQWLTSLFFSATIGFWVAFFTLDAESNILFFSSIIFSLSALVFLYLSLHFRKKVFHGSIEKIISIDDFKSKR